MAQLVVDRPIPHASGARQLLAGALAGQVAGLAMAAAVMFVFTAFLGTHPLYPLQVMSSLVLGDTGLQKMTPDNVVLGALLHQLGPALVWGLVFGTLVWALRIERGWNIVALGLGVGALSMIVDVYAIMPSAMVSLHGHDIWAEQVPRAWDWIAHLVFGGTLAVYPHIEARLALRDTPIP